MSQRRLFEGLEHLDMVDMIQDTLGIDEYEAQTGDNDELITLSFVVRGESVAEDLVDWLERGYEWVEDAERSEGELKPGYYVVFVEIPRRSTAPDRIWELLQDLDTLTGRPPEQYQLRMLDKLYPASTETIKRWIPLSPHQYRQERETDLNEWRTIAGLPVAETYQPDHTDHSITNLRRSAGLI